MSLLRRILRIGVVNRMARSAGRMVLPTHAYQKFDRKLPLLEPFDIPLPSGQKIRWIPQGDICSKFLRYDGWSGYESASTSLFYALAEHAPVTFDVGAYLAYFAFLAAGARAGNRAWAFEAVPLLAARCRDLAQANPHLAVQIVSGAVGKTAGTLDLYLSEDPFSSDTSTNPSHRPDRQPVSVPAICLDEFIRAQGIDRLDLLKIDTETTEPDVLAGLEQAIGRWRPTMLLEVLPTGRVAELQAFLTRHRYACAWVHQEGLLHRDRVVPDETLHNMNYLFYPENAHHPTVEIIRQRLRR